MSPGELARIKTDPRFLELERSRNVFSWTLFVIMFAAYLAFVFLVAFGAHSAATPVWGVVTLAFPAGLGVIVLAVLLTGIYVLRANGRYDRLTAELVHSLGQRVRS